MIYSISTKQTLSAIQAHAHRPPSTSPSSYSCRLLNMWLYHLIADRLKPSITDEKTLVFFYATKGLLHRHARHFPRGMTDAELRQALERHFGIFGGSGGPDRPSVSYQAAGLKIWGGLTSINTCKPPLFSDQATIRMARQLYSIPNPDERQLSMF